MTTDTHEVEIARLREAYAAWPPGTPVRLAKRTSNLFRFRDAPKAPADPKAQANAQANAQVNAQVTLRLPRPPGLSGAAWTFPRSATCCPLIPPPGPRGSAA